MILMEATCHHLRPLFRKAITGSSLQSFRPFSSSSGATARRWRFSSDDSDEGTDTGSAVYRHALKFQRPSTIRWQEELSNFVSFIGTVGFPPRIINTRNGNFGVHTMLKVMPSRESDHLFWVLLMMWEEMAKISIKHLKPKDHIYVSGHLGSYTKADKDGKLRMLLKVDVKEINYVAQLGRATSWQKAEDSESEDSGESIIEKRKNRLHLWQVFFANPHEWRDCRKNKVKRNHPDFIHKGGGEALWCNPNDPPWVARQLQLHDSRSGNEGQEEQLSYHSKLSPLVYDDWIGVSEIQ